MRFFFYCFSIILLAEMLSACPFCESTRATLREEIQASDIGVLLQPVESLEPVQTSPEVQLLQRPTFRIVEIFQGANRYQGNREIKIVFQGQPDSDQRFLLTGNHQDKFQAAEFSSGPGSLPIPKTLSEQEKADLAARPLTEDNILWAVPISVSGTGVEYLQTILKKDEVIERAKYVLNFLEHEDPTLSEDAYNEIAITSYHELKQLKADFPHQKLLDWIQDKSVSSSHRRQYLTLLGICGSKDDLPLLEKLILSAQAGGLARNSLDATMACYLLLAGEAGLELAVNEFLANPEAEYQNVYSVISALRFHGSDADAIPREKLAAALARMLDEPLYADLIIDDLVRWEYWQVDEKLESLFIEQDDRWLRMPIFKYFSVNPKPEAKRTLAKLKELDPRGYAQFQLFLTSRTDNAADEDVAEQTPKVAAISGNEESTKPDTWWEMLQHNVLNSVNAQLAIMVIGLVVILAVRLTWLHR